MKKDVTAILRQKVVHHAKLLNMMAIVLLRERSSKPDVKSMLSIRINHSKQTASKKNK
jgi:hypothetical protein